MRKQCLTEKSTITERKLSTHNNNNNSNNNDHRNAKTNTNMITSWTAAITSKTTSKTLKTTLILGLLYFVQGFPYGFQDKFIPLLLIINGHSPSIVCLTRLLMIAWVLKIFAAPLIDTTLTVTKWISISLICLILVCIYNVVQVDLLFVNLAKHSDDENTRQLSFQFLFTIFLLNFFSAFQDIAVDTIAMDTYQKRDILIGNTGQVVGYKLGSFFGGGLLFWIYSLINWNGLFLILTLFYSFVLLTFHTMAIDCLSSTGNNVKLKRAQQSIVASILNDDADESNRNVDNGLIKNTMKNNVSPEQFKPLDDTLPIVHLLLFVLVYKLGESAALATFPYFLVKCNVSNEQIVFWNGTFGSVCSIFGSIWAAKFSNKLLPMFINIRLIPLLVQLTVILLVHFAWIEPLFSPLSLIYYVSILSIEFLHLIGGIITPMTFTLMMQTCQTMPKSFMASRYTIISTIEVLGKLLLSSISGYIIEWLDFPLAYTIYFLLALMPSIIFIHFNYIYSHDPNIPANQASFTNGSIDPVDASIWSKQNDRFKYE